MRNPLTLAWWLFLLMCLQAASLILDFSHHLIWGRLGIYLLKSGYLVFAGILFFRYLSFRSQRSFETMVESYNRLVETPWSSVGESRSAFYKYLFHMGLILVTSSDLINLFGWSESTFRSSILLDGTGWLLILGWVSRAHWLKALGRKEKLKEFLDDARSRRQSQPVEAPQPGEVDAKRMPFVFIAVMSVALTLAVTGIRWQRAAMTYRVDDLKGCMETGFKSALEVYYQQGRLDGRLKALPCLAERRDVLQAGLGLHDGEPYLKAEEATTSDFFGDGIPGNEALELGTDGRFHLSKPR